MNGDQERSYQFTLHGNHLMTETVSDALFQDLDAEMIFRSLTDRFFVVPFCEYLKRYIYLKSGMTGSYRKVPFDTYRATLMDAFRETGTPSSLNRSKARVASRSGDWLRQSTAGRSAVLLLGFGLSMSAEDVNLFLTQAIHDHRLDDTDPLEGICAYCYAHHYGFSKMERLRAIYRDALKDGLDVSRIEELQPVGRAESRRVIEEDTALLRSLLDGNAGEKESMTLRTRKYFERLYGQICLCLQQARGNGEPVQPHDIEEILCASIPRNRHGNLIPEMNSSLKAELNGKRMSRQRLYDIRHGISEPTRYDLITLHFFLAAQTIDSDEDAKSRYLRFVRETNRDLTACGYGELYTASPYECFIMMCMLSVDPLGTFADVLEFAYNDSNHAQGGTAECQTKP